MLLASYDEPSITAIQNVILSLRIILDCNHAQFHSDLAMNIIPTEEKIHAKASAACLKSLNGRKLLQTSHFS